MCASVLRRVIGAHVEKPHDDIARVDEGAVPTRPVRHPHGQYAITPRGLEQRCEVRVPLVHHQDADHGPGESLPPWGVCSVTPRARPGRSGGARWRITSTSHEGGDGGEAGAPDGLCPPPKPSADSIIASLEVVGRGDPDARLLRSPTQKRSFRPLGLTFPDASTFERGPGRPQPHHGRLVHLSCLSRSFYGEGGLSAPPLSSLPTLGHARLATSSALSCAGPCAYRAAPRASPARRRLLSAFTRPASSS